MGIPITKGRVPYDQPGEGEVYAQTAGQPEDFAQAIKYDIVTNHPDGTQTFYRGVQSRHPPSGLPYKIVAAKPGDIVDIAWRGDEPRFCVPWTPKITLCGGTP